MPPQRLPRHINTAGGNIAESFVHGIGLVLETVTDQGTGQGIYRRDAMAWLRLWMPRRPW